MSEEKYFLHICEDMEVNEYDTLEDLMKEVRLRVGEGASLDSILIIRGVPMRLKLELQDA